MQMSGLGGFYVGKYQHYKLRSVNSVNYPTELLYYKTPLQYQQTPLQYLQTLPTKEMSF